MSASSAVSAAPGRRTEEQATPIDHSRGAPATGRTRTPGSPAATAKEGMRATPRPCRTPAYRPQRVSVPAATRPAFFAACGATLAAFAVLGLFTSLGPAFVAGTLHHPSRALAGLVAFLVFGSAAGAQALLLLRVTARLQLATGLASMAAGLAAVTAAVWLPSLGLFVAGGMAAGAGAGVLFKGTVSTVVSLAEPHRRGEALAGLFLAAYIGLAVPVLGLGVGTLYVSQRLALLGFATLLIAICAAVSRRLLRR